MKMVQVVQLDGTNKRLYQLVAPLVMCPEVIKQNCNYPFRTSEAFQWFIALDNEQVIGFIPVECKKRECVINNYYIIGKNINTLKLLLENVVASVDKEKELSAVSFIEDKGVFTEFGFAAEKVWTRYVKMKKNKQS